ncbi:MAG: hypothetical protein ABIH99_05450 [Candidatus Micrarchaeota archaeon]
MRARGLAFTFLSLLLLVTEVYALGITPRLEIDYEAGSNNTYEFYLINRNPDPIDVEVSVEGDMAQYFVLSDTHATIPGNSIGYTNFTLYMPLNLTPPGVHDTRVTVKELAVGSSGSGAQVSAVAASQMQVWVRVPYPGEYVDIGLDAPNVKINDPLSLTITAVGRGSNPISNARAKIKILDASGNLLEEIDAGAKEIPPATEVKFSATGTPIPTAGVYTAVAELIYGGKTATTQTEFKAGDILIKIRSFKDFTGTARQINVVSIDIESFWAEEIKDVYAEITARSSNGEVVGSFSTDKTSISPWSKATIKGYWESTTLNEGTYSLTAVLHYTNKTETATATATLGAQGAVPQTNTSTPTEEAEEFPYIYALGALAVLAALFYFLREKKKGADAKPESPHLPETSKLEEDAAKKV